MNKIELNVKGMGCPMCEKKIENKLSENENIKACKANHKKGLVSIKYENELDLNNIKNIINELGYNVID